MVRVSLGVGWVLLLSTLTTASVRADDVIPGHLEDAAKALIKSVGPYLDTNGNSQLKQLIATFPFGDAQNQIGRDLGNAPSQLQSHMVSELEDYVESKGLGSKFSVLDKDELDVATGGSIAVRFDNATSTRSALGSKGIAIAILGTLQKRSDGDFEITCEVVTQTASSKFTVKVGGGGVTPQTPSGSSGRSGRLIVDIYGKPKNSSNFQKIQFQETQDRGGSYRNVLFLEIDKQQYFGQPFEIHLINKQQPEISPQNNNIQGPPDKDRVFGAAVYLDGVASFLMKEDQPGGGFVWRRDCRHPAYVPKHVLTAANRAFVKTNTDNDRFIKSDLLYATTPGHSIWRIRGFQKGEKTAKSFIFGTAAESIASGLDQNISQIGLISVHFYAERLPNDLQPAYAPASGGILAGPEVPSPTIKVGIKDWYPVPIEVWHILYAYKGETSCPPLQPVTF